MKLWTIQMSKWRLARDRGIPLINTTVMNGLPWLAPTWDMVKAHKAGALSDEGYTLKFIPLMVISQCDHKEQWMELALQDEVVLACYCRYGWFCHRNLLVREFEQFCKKHGIEFTYAGELGVQGQ